MGLRNVPSRPPGGYEQAAMGVDHGTVGFLLAANWKLPESLALAICHHHASEHLETADSRVSHLIALAKLAHSLIALSRGTHELPEMLATGKKPGVTWTSAKRSGRCSASVLKSVSGTTLPERGAERSTPRRRSGDGRHGSATT